MTNHEMTKKFLSAQEAVEKAKKSLEKATEDLKKLEGVDEYDSSNFTR